MEKKGPGVFLNLMAKDKKNKIYKKRIYFGSTKKHEKGE